MNSNRSPAQRRNTDAIAVVALLLALGGALLLLAQFRGGTADRATSALVTPTACPTPDLSTEVPIHNLSTTVPTEVGHIDPTPLPLPAATEARILSPCDQLAVAEAQRAYPEPPPYPGPPATPIPTRSPSDPCIVDDMLERGLYRQQPAYQAASADVVVRGTVTSISEPRWNTPDGSRPANPCGEHSRNYIYRLVTVRVLAYLKGTQNAQDVFIEAWGGTVGQDTFEISTAFDQYSAGEEVVLFLGGERNNALDKQPSFSSFEHYTLAKGRAKNFFQEISEDELLAQIHSAP